MNGLPLWALMAGAAIAIQAAINAQLGVLLKNSMLAASIVFLVSCVFTVLVMMWSARHYPQLVELKTIPVYLWFSGGVLSAVGVGLFYYLIPKMGVGPMMSYALSGQLLIAVAASHFGWFDLPEHPLSILKVAGVIALLAGVLLINWESGYAH